MAKDYQSQVKMLAYSRQVLAKLEAHRKQANLQALNGGTLL